MLAKVIEVSWVELLGKFFVFPDSKRQGQLVCAFCPLFFAFCLPLLLFSRSGTAVEGLEVRHPFCNHKDEISVLRLLVLTARRSSAPLWFLSTSGKESPTIRHLK